MVESMTVYGRKRRRYKAYLVAEIRQEARRCRTDLEMATENLHGISLIRPEDPNKEDS